jgi:isopentenyldiphosphate isomerase
MTAFVRKSNKYLFWVPKRAATKQTWPSYLDNSVAGGITAGDGPLETIVRECGKLCHSSEATKG